MLEPPAGGERDIKSSEITKSTQHTGKLRVCKSFDKLVETKPARGEDQLSLIESVVPSGGSAWVLL